MSFIEKWNKILRQPKHLDPLRPVRDGTYNKESIKLFLKYCPPDKYRWVLDIGAGEGTETHILHTHGYDVIGITFGKENIVKARENYGIILEEMDMHDLEYINNAFDGAILIQTFEHCFSPWLVILELRRVLRDGGRVYIDSPHPDDQVLLDSFRHTCVLSPKQLIALFKKAGFKLVIDLTKDNRVYIIFEKLPDETFKSWENLKWIVK